MVKQKSWLCPLLRMVLVYKEASYLPVSKGLASGRID